MPDENSARPVPRAREFRGEGDLDQAGHCYTLAAYEGLGDDSGQPYGADSHVYFSRTTVARALLNHLRAATCYHISGEDEYMRFRCQQGILLSDEMKVRTQREPAPDHPVEVALRGVWDEFAGDFHVLEGTPEQAAPRYEAAQELYAVPDDYTLILADFPHQDILNYYHDVAQAAGEDMDEWLERRYTISFEEWIDIKRDRLPRFLSELEERREWELGGY